MSRPAVGKTVDCQLTAAMLPEGLADLVDKRCRPLLNRVGPKTTMEEIARAAYVAGVTDMLAHVESEKTK